MIKHWYEKRGKGGYWDKRLWRFMQLPLHGCELEMYAARCIEEKIQADRRAEAAKLKQISPKKLSKLGRIWAFVKRIFNFNKKP